MVMCTPRISRGTRGMATAFDDVATVRVGSSLPLPPVKNDAPSTIPAPRASNAAARPARRSLLRLRARWRRSRNRSLGSTLR